MSFAADSQPDEQPPEHAPELAPANDDSPDVQPLETPLRFGRYMLALTSITVVGQLVALQVRDAIFGGAGWLSSVKYIAWSERFGLVAVIVLFSLAAVGTWLLAWFYGLRLARVRGTAALRWAGISWVVLLALDIVVRHKLAAVLGDAFDLMEFSDGVGGPLAMARNLWRWYAPEVVMAVLAVVVGIVGGWIVLKLLARFRTSWGVVDRVSLRMVRNGTLVANAGVFLFLTAFAHTWPTTREVLVDETLVGQPFGAFVSWATDFDGDGYSQFDNPPDTAPLDGDRHPYAIDIPGDGIDQDLLLGDLDPTALRPAWSERVERWSEPGPMPTVERDLNVMVVVLETTRHDALLADLDGRPAMPNLRAAIANGALAPTHFHATRGFTTTSLGNLFWGTYFDPGDSLLDDMRGAGREIVAFSGYDLAAEGVELSAGLDPSEVLFDPRADPNARRDTSPARTVVSAIEDWLASRDRGSPFFGYVHFQDPHFPYDQDNAAIFGDSDFARRDIEPDNRDAVWRRYLDQVHAVDVASGRLLTALEHHAPNTAVIFLGDHGEALFDDGLHLGHGIAVDPVMTHSAMVVVNSPVDVPNTLSHADIRRLVRRMLSAPSTVTPTLVHDDDDFVLHYIGAPTVPARIGISSPTLGWLVYDFEHHRVVDGAGTEPREFGTGPRADVAEDLVDLWAYLRYLNRGRGGWEVP